MVNFTILAGGFTSFVASYLLDTDARTLSVLSTSPTGQNPAWLSLNPQNSSVLYAINKNTDNTTVGKVQSFVIGPQGKLSNPVDVALSGGSSPAYTVRLSTGEVAVVNYNDGSGRVIPTTPDGLYFDQSAPSITFPVPPAGVGEGASHPHMVYEYENSIFVPDLGGDKIWRLAKNNSGDWAIEGFVPQPSHSGPRHMSIYNDEMYVIHELSSTLTVQPVPAAPNGTTTILANVSIIPPDPPAGAAFAAAEVLIPPLTHSFITPYIYVSNRNTGVQDPRGDAINVYKRTKSGLELISRTYTGLDQVRGMMIGPNGGEDAQRYLVAAGVAGTAGTVVYERTNGGKNLTEVARNLDYPTWATFVWLE